MHKERLMTGAVSAMLAVGLGWAGAMCLATGFGLAVDDSGELFRWCLIVSAVGSLLFSCPWGGRVFALLTAVLAGYLWQLGNPLEQLLGLVQTVSIRYDIAYGWGYLWFFDRSVSADYPLGMLEFLTAWLVSRYVCRGKGWFPALLVAVLPVAACFLVTDTVPQPCFLFLSMGGMALLVITHSVRRQSVFQGARLGLMALIPLLAALALLFYLVPQDAYVDRSDTVRSSILSLGQRLARGLESAMLQLTAVPQKSPGDVDLAGLGPQNPSSYPVMEVTAETAGPLYLRSWDCDVYTGTGWHRSADRKESFSFSGEALLSLKIVTEGTLEYRLVPYYPGKSLVLTGGIVPNPQQIREYEYGIGLLPHAGEAQSQTVADTARYLELPAQTREGAQKILARLTEGSHSENMVESIGTYVRSCARYDLSPDQMPGDRDDFALWFLEEAERGYCTHFATAAVVLLRSAGIPARYVTGYLVQAVGGETVTVTQREAHAWAEYYDSRLGIWRILETTPPDLASATPGEGESVLESTEQTLATLPTNLPDAQQFPSEEAATTQPTPAPGRGNLGKLGWTLAVVGAAALLTEGQRLLRLCLRRCRQRRGTNRSRSLALWREADLLHRLLGAESGEELVEIAQKAKFSPREPETEELTYLETDLALCREQLRRKAWRLRMVHRYLYAAY